MAVKLMQLRMVPEDELEEICSMFDAHNIGYYHTPEGAFGISAAALWLEDAAQLTHAKALLKEYQKQRAASAQAAYQQQRQQGQAPTFWQGFAARPLQVIVYIAVMVFFVYLLLVPILDLMR